MDGHNLIAYIPTINQRHLSWFSRHQDSELFLVSQEMAQKFLPRLIRNLAAIPTMMVMRMLEEERLVRHVSIFDPIYGDPDLSSPTWKDWVLPDEDVTRLLADKYLLPAGCNVKFETIWARWDMLAVLQEQPVVSDIEISVDALNAEILNEACHYSDQSPDWWRRVGAMVVSANGTRLAAAYNTHLPNEYETYIFGDPSLNRDAGQVGKSCVLHAEDAAITECARYGRAVEGGKIYVSTFPCESCARKISFSGIRTVYFRDGYSSLNAQEVLRSHGVRIVQVKDPLVSA